MKTKASELSGMVLCYVVCMIEMPHLVWGDTIGEHHASKQIVVPELREPDCYSPYMNWAMFGPIIEREGINTFKYNKLDASEHDKWGAHKVVPRKAMDGVEYSAALCLDGPTPLIAAMRCYVASKLGDEVKIPKELK